MPIVVALIVRSIIQMAVTLGVISFAEKYILPLIHQGLEEVMIKFGVDEETAKDIVSNELLQYAEQIGIGVLVLRAKLPTKIAELLGFTSKGFALRKITGVAANVGIKTTGTATEAVESIATVVAKTTGTLKSKIEFLLKIIGVTVGMPTGFLYMAAQYIDYGSWSGSAYQGTFQKILSWFGLDADRDARQPRTISQDIFSKIYTAFNNEGAVGLNDPYKNQTVIFSRNNLLDLADKAASHILLENQKVSAKDLIAALLPLTILKTAAGSAIASSGDIGGAVRAPIVPVKVFTGIVSQGTLGAAVEFTSRENDLIESIDELKDSAQNNLAPFIAALPGKIIYELKIVSSVTTKDGFKRVGESQRIISKYTSAGQPLYRTIINKFAVMDIFVLTDKRVKTKISSIILGPTDSVKLQPKTNDLAQIETSIKNEMFTSNVADITGIQTAQPITITAPPIQPVIIQPTPAPAPAVAPQAKLDNSFYLPRDGYSGVIYRVKDGVLWGLDVVNSLFNNEERVRLGNYGAQFAASTAKMSALGVNIGDIQHMQYFDTIPGAYRQANWTGSFNDFFNVMLPATATAPAKPLPAACQTQTLFEWYQSAGQSLPGLNERATLYEKFGLGLAAYYTGTGEQNIKLLNYLKRQSGCLV